MKREIMNTKELPAYLCINEKKVYALITNKKLPATKITGKWIFLMELVDRWLEQSISDGSVYPFSNDVVLMTGSDDLLFSELGSMLHEQDRRHGFLDVQNNIRDCFLRIFPFTFRIIGCILYLKLLPPMPFLRIQERSKA
jgi:excisionase family DNA binding protein